ncbi:hypothetical protein ABT144_26605 [Streptomyces sp. NPDC002039]|nr:MULTISPECIES: hypothetical protein [unclassified Streptomyces]MCX5071677.1 hypothetical protein [Streptomyces sp. NBC_00424]MCX5157469.1 hypothetical protein [Streptomyces sp. NBC_00291]WUD44937.1 hypothetical protein OHA84_32925 [Streptomyces sp. NBC_00513]
MTDEAFEELLIEARAEARRVCLPPAEPTGEPDFALRTQHAEFGASEH